MKVTVTMYVCGSVRGYAVPMRVVPDRADWFALVAEKLSEDEPTYQGARRRRRPSAPFVTI